MLTRYIHVTDAPIVLHDGDILKNHHIVLGGARYGRILFTESCAVLVVGRNITISDCYIEVI